MKKWTSLALLGLTSASLLVACGSKKEESNFSAKETQTSMSSSQKKTNQSSKKKNTKTTEASSEEAVNSSQTATASGTTNDDKASPASTQMVPEELIGTWTGTTEIAKDVQMTVAADGTVTTTANFYQADVNPIRTATARAKAVQASGNVYYWETDDAGAFDALLPGIAGLGGANAKVKAGFILEEGHYTPIVFVTGLNEDFDYSKYNDFRVSLTK